MKKYYCDCCGKECKHTPKIVMPHNNIETFNVMGGGRTLANLIKEKLSIESIDLCEECQIKIAYVSDYLQYFSIEEMKKIMEKRRIN